MSYPTRTIDWTCKGEVRKYISIKGKIQYVLFPGIRLFVFAILDNGYGKETVLSVTRKAISDWEEDQPHNRLKGRTS